MGALAEFHKQGHLVLIDSLDSIVLTGGLVSDLPEVFEPTSSPPALETEILRLSSSTATFSRTSESQNIPKTDIGLVVTEQSQPVPPAILQLESNSVFDSSSTVHLAIENDVTQAVLTTEATTPEEIEPVPTETISESSHPSAAETEELAQLVEPYLWHAKCKSLWGGRAKRRTWNRVIELLKIFNFSDLPDETYLSVTVLLRLAKQKDGDPFEIVDYLKSLAILWNCNEMANTFLARYSHF